MITRQGFTLERLQKRLGRLETTVTRPNGRKMLTTEVNPIVMARVDQPDNLGMQPVALRTQLAHIAKDQSLGSARHSPKILEGGPHAAGVSVVGVDHQAVSLRLLEL